MSHHKQSKHIDVRYHFARELVKNKRQQLTYIETDKIIADKLTKASLTHAHQQHTNMMLV
jgi:hypothetical protein